MLEFPKIVTKKGWFVLFNVGTVIYLIASGTLKWQMIDIFSCGVALALMNGIAWISARKYKDWK